jgi:hypothetical protein
MLAVDQLLGTLGPAEVIRHRGITHQLLDEREVLLAPRLEPHHRKQATGLEEESALTELRANVVEGWLLETA